MIAKKIKEIRLKNNLLQKEIGEILGISIQTVNDIENNRHKITLTNLIKFADYFCVSLDYLVGRTDNPNVNK